MGLKPARVPGNNPPSTTGTTNADLSANPSFVTSIRNWFSSRFGFRGGSASRRGQQGVDGQSGGTENPDPPGVTLDKEKKAYDDAGTSAAAAAAPNGGVSNRHVQTQAASEDGSTGQSTTTGQTLQTAQGDINNDFDYRRRPGEDEDQHQARVEAHLAERFGKGTGGTSTTTKILMLGGISAAITFAILAARYNDTNASVGIKTITIEEYNPPVANYKKVTVAYDRSGTITRRATPPTTLLPTDKNSFNPCRGDIVTIGGSPMNDTHEYRVMDAGVDTVILKIATARLDPFKNYSPIATGKTVWGGTLPYTYDRGDDTVANELLHVYTDFGNQMADVLDGGLDTLLDIAETVVDKVVERVLPSLGGAASRGFCAMVPILCDSTIWIIIGLLIAGLIVFIVVS